MKNEVPIVDKESFYGSAVERERCVKTLGKAFEEVGFVRVSNHGVPSKELEKCYADYRKFFLLPESIKQKYNGAKFSFQRGWTPPGTEKAIGTAIPDSKENLFFGPSVIPMALSQRFPELYAANIWPEEVPGMEENTMALYAYLEELGMQVLDILTAYLQVGPTQLFEMMRQGPHVLRPLYYPPRVGSGGEHVDLNLLTILPPATGAGLMIQKRNGEWLEGPASEDSFLVQAGDQLQHLTGGRLLSARHKVTVPPDRDEGRFSVAFFIHVRSDVLMEVLPGHEKYSMYSEEYAPILAKTFVEDRLAQIKLAPGR
jgi:isopenicillin N synthase-like dioxygenase